ncbi:hypothetical protein HYDPIDRAFT_32123 [Hydnomerulius pinastri MD-312]|uniref:Unplaced genomic scaffold scaffold_36, whole genome shotgun sequence n=1 Tax=Hydnomerulius pinastri MD-312 TaxID=994086 RepID=A0A0C9WAV2_9AGAM|nr:hypothetical protein HYDPIDRAFT_32123 [Hydnomerulius pinastri MD-312]
MLHQGPELRATFRSFKYNFGLPHLVSHATWYRHLNEAGSEEEKHRICLAQTGRGTPGPQHAEGGKEQGAATQSLSRRSLSPDAEAQCYRFSDAFSSSASSASSASSVTSMTSNASKSSSLSYPASSVTSTSSDAPKSSSLFYPASSVTNDDDDDEDENEEDTVVADAPSTSKKRKAKSDKSNTKVKKVKVSKKETRSMSSSPAPAPSPPRSPTPPRIHSSLMPLTFQYIMRSTLVNTRQRERDQ